MEEANSVAEAMEIFPRPIRSVSLCAVLESG